MADGHERMTAAPPDDGGSEGVHELPNEALQVCPEDASGPAPELHTDPARAPSAAMGNAVTILAALALSMAVAVAWLAAHC